MSNHWIGVASRDHVQDAVRGSFCQFNHGKQAPLLRIKKGDRLYYYSPRVAMGSGESVKAFTAVGEVLDDKPYQLKTAAQFRPFRRAVHYFAAHDASILPLLTHLSFTKGHKSWGIVMRRGFFQIVPEDSTVIAHAMGL